AVELTDLATLRAQGPPIFERVRVEQAGSIERSPHWWDRTLHQVEVPGSEPAKGQVALYRAEGGALEGYVIYEVASDADGMRPRGTLTLRELLAATPAAYAALWSFCCGVDLVTSIDARMRPTDEVLPYLLADGRDVKLTSRDDFVWVRVLDVPAALEGRAFATPGRLVLEVVDGAGLASGRFAVDASGEGTQCRPTTAPADLTLPVGALGSLYLGGVSARTLQLAGLVDEHLAGAVARADCMFRTSRAPWCTTWF
ncbi:MAG TPA: sterol carrier protein domain-containing protein, partial [Acidimicrobiales bacterium]|nr:sterol carrier protein domain-containing protein [Acidimicrobiales bacterium]